MRTMMFWYGGGWAWWQAGLMWIAMIAFWGLIIWAVYALVSSAVRHRGEVPPSGRADPGLQDGSAFRILDERLARGEISADEYRRLRDVLAGREQPGAGAADEPGARVGAASRP